jgi:transcriptional regulator with XRE-family HTH domain
MEESRYREEVAREVRALLAAHRERCPDADLAQALDVSPSYLDKVRQRGGVISEALARRICALVGVEWVDVVGGTKGSRQYRSFRQDKIKRVHYKSRMRLTSKELKEAKLEK